MRKPFRAGSQTTETHPSGEFQKQEYIFDMRWLRWKLFFQFVIQAFMSLFSFELISEVDSSLLLVIKTDNGG